MDLDNVEVFNVIVRQLTPQLQYSVKKDGHSHDYTVEDLFLWCDQPFGHPVRINGKQCFFLPQFLYLKIQEQSGLYQVDSFQDNQYIIDQIAYIVQLYPNIMDINFSDTTADSFVCLKWQLLFPDSADQEIVIYYNIKELQSYNSPHPQKEKFSFLQPQARENYISLFNREYASIDALSLSAAFSLRIQQLHTLQQKFDLLLSIYQYQKEKISVQTLQQVDLNDVSMPLQLILNFLYIRQIRRQVNNYYASSNGGDKNILLLLPFQQGRRSENTIQFDFLRFLDDASLQLAIDDIFVLFFVGVVKENNECDVEAICRRVTHYQCNNHPNRAICPGKMDLAQLSCNQAQDQLRYLAFAAKADFLRQSYLRYQRVGFNQFLSLRSTTTEKRQITREIVDNQQYFFQKNYSELLAQDTIFNAVQLKNVCKSINTGSTIDCNCQGFLSNSEKFEDYKEQIRQRLGGLPGFEIEVKIQLRTASKKWDLKTVE